jgi:hypothetical protein
MPSKFISLSPCPSQCRANLERTGDSRFTGVRAARRHPLSSIGKMIRPGSGRAFPELSQTCSGGARSGPDSPPFCLRFSGEPSVRQGYRCSALSGEQQRAHRRPKAAAQDRPRARHDACAVYAAVPWKSQSDHAGDRIETAADIQKKIRTSLLLRMHGRFAARPRRSLARRGRTPSPT